MPLELKLVKLLVVKGAEFRSQPTESPDDSDLWKEEVNNEAEPHPLSKRQTFLGFGLDLSERISYCQKIRDQLRAAISGKCKVAHSVGGVEGPTCQLASLQGMSRPRYDHVCERHIGSCLIANQTTLLHQFVAKPPEAKSVLVFAETRPGYDGKPYIGKARTVTVAMLEAQVHHMTNNERKQILVAKH